MSLLEKLKFFGYSMLFVFIAVTLISISIAIMIYMVPVLIVLVIISCFFAVIQGMDFLLNEEKPKVEKPKKERKLNDKNFE